MWNYGRRVRLTVGAESYSKDGSTFVAVRSNIESVGNRTLRFHQKHAPLVVITPIGDDANDSSSVDRQTVQPFGDQVSVPRLENVARSSLVRFPELDGGVIGWRVSLTVEARPTLYQRIRGDKHPDGAIQGWEWQDNVFIARPCQGDGER